MSARMDTSIYQQLHAFLLTGELPPSVAQRKKLKRMASSFTVKDNRLFYTGPCMQYMRLVLLSEEERMSALMECHNNPGRGKHNGARGTRNRAVARYYWPTMIQDIKEWVRCCHRCQMKDSRKTIPPALHPIKKMTKPKTRTCLHCQGLNAANRKTCQSCFASLSITEWIKLKEESLRSGDWRGKVKEHRNASRVVDSARISVKKLHELGFKPLLFMGKERRGGYTEVEVITGIGPVPDGPVREIIKEMTALYEYFLRNFSELLATAPAPSDEAAPAASTTSTQDPNIVPVTPPPPTSPPLSSPPPPPPPPATPPLPSLSLSSPSPPPPPPVESLTFPPPSAPSLSCCPPAKDHMRRKKELLGKRNKSEHTGCKKHTWQKIFFSEKMIERRSNNGKEEVRVHWKSCSACGKEWEDTWEPAVNFSV